MKCNCGPTRKEKEAKLEQWHDFFTIFPRRVGSHDCRMLETIQRRRRINMFSGGREWQYRAKE